MARSQEKPLRKVSGGRYIAFRGKRKFELAGYPAMTKLSPERKIKKVRTLGGNQKIVHLNAAQINLTLKGGKTQKTEILNVVGNPANPNLVRRNILTKGAVVETKLGRARITSRPGQEGTINGVLV